MEENKKELEAAKIEDWDQDVVGGTNGGIKGRPGANGYNTGMEELEDSHHRLNTALGVDTPNAFPGGASSRYETG